MEELARLTATYGFPLVVAFYLLVRLEKATDRADQCNQSDVFLWKCTFGGCCCHSAATVLNRNDG